MLKEKCYKSFHLLAEWCEGKGISGIRYPSTRMKLINERGSNLVLFDADYPYPKVYSDFCYQKSIQAILSRVLLEMHNWVA